MYTFLGQSTDFAAQAKTLQEQNAEMEKQMAQLKKQLEVTGRTCLRINTKPCFTDKKNLWPTSKMNLWLFNTCWVIPSVFVRCISHVFWGGRQDRQEEGVLGFGFFFGKSLADSQSSLVLDRACWMRSIGVRGDIHPAASLFCFNLKIGRFFGCFCFDEMDHES